MKKIITTFILIFISAHFLLAQTTSNAIIINSTDVVEQTNSNIASFYIKGISPKQISDFSSKIATVSGLKLYSLKVTDADLKMVHGKIELQNNYNKRALITVLKQFEIATIVYDGQPTELEKFFYNKENARGVSK